MPRLVRWLSELAANLPSISAMRCAALLLALFVSHSATYVVAVSSGAAHRCPYGTEACQQGTPPLPAVNLRICIAPEVFLIKHRRISTGYIIMDVSSRHASAGVTAPRSFTHAAALLSCSHAAGCTPPMGFCLEHICYTRRGEEVR